MQNKPILNSNQTIDNKYKIQFYLSTDYWQKYRVKDKNGKNLFLKLIRNSKLSPEHFTQGRLLQAEILTHIDNKNVVKLEDTGETKIDNQKYNYIVTEFISGESLQDKMIREGIISPISTETVIIDILKGLRAFHNPIVHNDINPKSIYMDYSGNTEKAIISDFDFARYVTSSSKDLNLEHLNPFYIAPELYEGKITPQSDIFAVGALFYNLVVGIPPWFTDISGENYSFEEIKDIVSNKRSISLEFGIHGFNEIRYEKTKKIIKKALELDVDKRFKTVDEFINYLNKDITIKSDQSQAKQSSNTRIRNKSGDGFAGIVGMYNLKDILLNDVIKPLQEPECFKKYDIPLPNGMLLYGPPRCGKTFISEKFAEEVGFNFIKVIPSDLASRYINGTQEKIAKLFKEAEENAPTTLFFDEFDALVPDRNKVQFQERASEVNEFLAQLDNCGKRRIFVIAATNNPQIIDPAILSVGRIDYKKYVPPPNYKTRKGLFKKYLENRPVDLAVDYDKLAELTKNNASGDIKTLTDFAARRAKRKNIRITQDILLDVIQSRKPSVSKSQLKEYEKYQSTKEDDKPRVGFSI